MPTTKTNRALWSVSVLSSDFTSTMIPGIITHTSRTMDLNTTELQMTSSGMLKAETKLSSSAKLVSDADGVLTFPLGPDHVELSTTLPHWMDFTKPPKTWPRIIFVSTADISRQMSDRIWLGFGNVSAALRVERSIGQRGQRYWESTNVRTGYVSRTPRFQHQQKTLKSKGNQRN